MVGILKNKWFWIIIAVIVLIIVVKVVFGKNKPQKVKYDQDQLPPGWSAENDARQLHDAMDGWGTDEETIWLILNNKNQAQLAAIYNAYIDLYGVSILEDFEDDLSGEDLNRALNYFSFLSVY